MTARDDRAYDIQVNGTGFLLAGRDELGRGSLAWERTKPRKAYWRRASGNVQPGEMEDEYVITWDNAQAAGWGDQRSLKDGTYLLTQNVDARFPGQIILGPLWTGINASAGGVYNSCGFFEIPGNSSLWVYRGRSVERISNPASPTLTQVLDIIDGPVTQVGVFNGKAYGTNYHAGTNGALRMFQINSSGTASYVTAGTCQFDAIAPGADSNGAILVVTQRQGGASMFRKLILNDPSGPDPSDESDYSNSVPIGEPGEVLRWLVQYGYETIAFGPSGAWAFDEFRNSINVLPELKNFRDDDNGKQSIVWHGSLYIPTLRGVFRYDNGGVITDVTPTAGVTVRSESNSYGSHWGRPVALWGSEQWLFCLMWNGTDTWLFAGREDENSGRFVWHTLSYFGNVGPYTAGAITGKTTPPRMFIAQQAAGDAVQYSDLSRGDNPLLDRAYRYASSGIFYTGFHDLGLPGVRKIFEELIVEVECPTSSETVTVAARMTEIGSWTTLGTVSSTGLTTLRPTSAMSGTGLQLKVTFARGSTATNTPILRSLKARLIAQPARGQLYRAVVVLRDGLRDRHGKPMPSASTLYSALTALEGGTTTFPVVDPFGTSSTCVMEGPIQVTQVRQQGEGRPYYVASFTLREVGA